MSNPVRWSQIGIAPRYEISEEGSVRLCGSGKPIRVQVESRAGYLYFKAWLASKSGPKTKTVTIHRALAKAFIPNPNNFPVVRHLDGNTGNPHIDNLAWGTHSQNQLDRLRHGTSLDGEKNHKCKLRTLDVVVIRARLLAGEPRKVLQAEYDLSKSTIRDIANWRIRKHA